MKKLLVPTDFSFYANEALNYALELSRHTDARIMLVHGYDFMEYSFRDKTKNLVEEHNKRMRAELQDRLEKMRQSIKEAEGLEIVTAIYDGPVVQSIVQAIDDFSPDLVIMGTLGETGIKDRLLGSKSSSVLRHVSVPVLVVPPDFAWQAPWNIAVAIQEDHERISLLNPVLELGVTFMSTLHLLVFAEEDADPVTVMTGTRAVNHLREKLRNLYPNPVKTVQLTGHHMEQDLEEFVRDHDIQLLVLFTHHKTWLDHLLGRSTTQKLARFPVVPVLSLHAGPPVHAY